MSILPAHYLTLREPLGPKIFVGRSTNAPIVVGNPDLTVVVFFNIMAGCGIGGNCCGTGSVAEDDVDEDNEITGGVGGRGAWLARVGEILAVRSPSPSLSSGVSSLSVCTPPYGVSCDSSGRECATESGVVLALVVPSLQGCKITSRFWVSSQLSTYSQSRLRGVIPVGMSSRVA